MPQSCRYRGPGRAVAPERSSYDKLGAPLVVQAAHIAASAILVESYLSFLGAGTPPHIPSWGNIMAEGRPYAQIGFWIVLFPGLFLMLTVLSINLIGDGLRDRLKV